MANITETQAGENFASLKNLLLASAPSQKAYDFAVRVVEEVEVKGGNWLLKNAAELQITRKYGSLERDTRGPFPVADNRNFYMAHLQMTLLNALS